MKPRVTHENFQTASVDDYHLDFADIWARDASERSVFDLWLHVVDHASRIARAIRKQEPPAVIDDIADTTVWLWSFMAQCQKTATNAVERCFHFAVMPSQVLWNKYPAICPGCFDHSIIARLDLKDGETPFTKLALRRDDIVACLIDRVRVYEEPEACTCFTRLTNRHEHSIITALRTELDQLRRLYAGAMADAKKCITTTAGIEKMIGAIYANAHHVLSLETMAFHLLEEVGEASEAIKDLYTFDDSREPYTPELHATRSERLLEELADVFSWLFTIALKIKSTYVRHAGEYLNSILPDSGRGRVVELTFAQIVWSKYGMTKSGANWDRLKCAGCQSAPCACPRDIRKPWSDHPDQSTTTKLNQQARQQESADAMPARNLIFVSYVSRDQGWLDRLRIVIAPLEQYMTLSIWDASKIHAGQRWRSETDSALRRARVAVLLVSSDYLASDFIAKNELPPLLDAAKEGGLTIIWVPIRASLYEVSCLEQYQAAADPAHPLESLSAHEQDAALVKVCKDIKEAARPVA